MFPDPPRFLRPCPERFYVLYFVAPQPGQKILLTFRKFDTECAFDYFKVYDGSSRQKLLGSFSGSTMPPNLISNSSAVSKTRLSLTCFKFISQMPVKEIKIPCHNIKVGFHSGK